MELSPAMATDDVVQEIMRLHRSLPYRPGIEEVEAARTLIQNLEREDQARLEGVKRRVKGKNVPEELFRVLQDMQRSMIHFHGKEQTREAVKLIVIDLEDVHMTFDDLIQRASRCLLGSSGTEEPPSTKASYDLSNNLSYTVNTSLASLSASSSSSSSFLNDMEYGKALGPAYSKDDSYMKKTKTTIRVGGLELNLHGNLISELPESIGNLLGLVRLDLRGNQLKTLPPTIAGQINLQELNLSSNGLSYLPKAIGSLVRLEKLNIQTNNIEEIPHTIGRCASLKEFRADYNRLKALPEAVGRIESLEILTVRYNNIKLRPTTMSSLTNLKELDVSFNELESVPESLCFATSLVKMNMSNNSADLQSLLRSNGNLEMLQVLDMSNNQIRVLPESFRMLTRLCVLNVEGNPLEVPPMNVTENGAQAVVQYKAELVVQKQVKSHPGTKPKKSWGICFFSKSNKCKQDGVDFGKA
ncbi:Plant intracellular Ras-group-related LRR protein 4 [Striga hermonthica]|uniref:Plant intracellular Ras-group-related LRR protein 4 n=1 Tax=Striga hermonthica TaxID=68872 RepID=A0A9N7MP48_STRHE|nr:Plant intracellular Ras-group-related LRR protein 4 [Striga hermonthica]